jgi:hypothetical protein
MAELFNPASWTTTTKPGVTDFQNIAADIATRGSNMDFAKYGLPNLAWVTLVPGDIPGNTYTVTAASWSGGIVTLTVSTSHNFAVGQRFSLSGVTPTGYNGTDLVTTSGTTGTTIKYALGSNPGAWSSGGTIIVDELASPGLGTLCVDQTVTLRIWNGSSFAVAGQPAPGPWQNVSGGVGFQNGWANTGTSTYNQARYRTEGIDSVRLSGNINTGSNNTVAFTLPSGYQPAKQVNLVCWNSGGNNTTFVMIAANGQVAVSSFGTIGNISLEGLTFQTS